MTVDIDKIKKLVALVEQNHLTEITVEEGDTSVTVKADIAGEITAPAAAATATQPYYEAPLEPAAYVELAEPEEVNGNLFQIKSPMIGVFYRYPSPDSPPFTEEGDEIEEGQTIGLIEAMKVFSEIPSEVAGKVVSMPVENGKLVQQGDVLVVIDTSGE
jgi:acetyl-CoA carboxylase biotin carboxyl carrier protein